jgi:hypothetical protein
VLLQEGDLISPRLGIRQNQAQWKHSTYTYQIDDHFLVYLDTSAESQAEMEAYFFTTRSMPSKPNSKIFIVGP